MATNSLITDQLISDQGGAAAALQQVGVRTDDSDVGQRTNDYSS